MSIKVDIHVDSGEFRLASAFELPETGISAIFGPSGAGKTTLLRALAGLQPATGKISLGGTTWQDETVCLPAHAREAGYVFQESNLFRHLSVSGNLEYAHKRVPDGQRRVSMEQAIELLDLKELLNRNSHTLSGGEQQRVAIARALLSSPRIMLLDEPLASLDRARKEEILPLLKNLPDRLGMPMIYVSHAINEVARIADQLLLLDKGQVTATGPIQEMLTRLDLPLSRDTAGGAVIEATVTHYDSEFALTQAEFGGGTFNLPGDHGAPGQKLRLQILARDVSLSLVRHTDTSILNVLAARVAAIEADNSAQAIIQLDVGGTPLLARITRKSVAELQLQKGSDVFAQVKTVALIS